MKDASEIWDAGVVDQERIEWAAVKTGNE